MARGRATCDASERNECGVLRHSAAMPPFAGQGTRLYAPACTACPARDLHPQAKRRSRSRDRPRPSRSLSGFERPRRPVDPEEAGDRRHRADAAARAGRYDRLSLSPASLRRQPGHLGQRVRNPQRSQNRAFRDRRCRPRRGGRESFGAAEPPPALPRRLQTTGCGAGPGWRCPFPFGIRARRDASAFLTRWRSVSRSSSPARRASSLVTAANGTSSIASTSISPRPTR